MSQVYGLHAVAALLESDPGRVRVIHVQRGRRDERVQALVAAARARGIRVEPAERAWLDRRCPGSHQGVVADCHALTPLPEKAFEERFAALPAPRLLLALDGVTDPRNLGACLRSANAAGVQAVLLPRRRSAPLSDVALKTAAGGAEGLMLVEVANLARRLEWLKERGVWVIGADGGAETLWNRVDLTGSVAIVVGSEGEGLRALTAKLCDERVRIPMQGTVASLNVSVATGILLFEAVRQRLASAPPRP
ncbi:MAG TPA: 23S rRNA (guanosine(2251)-2'-O)-methyltransferase RlmB [Pseudomonadales bacterium]